MGGCAASRDGGDVTGSTKHEGSSQVPAGKTKWKVIPDLQHMGETFIADGTIASPPAGGDLKMDVVELRALLEDPIGLKYIGSFARKIFTQESFFAWVDIQEYKSIPTEDYRRCKANHIYKKYIAEGVVLQVAGLPIEEQHTISETLEGAKGDKSLITSALFDQLQKVSFDTIYRNTFIPFKLDESYNEMRKQMKSTYNAVTVDDFEYMDRIGQGGFGRVVHVKKKSTGMHYAMKLQLKTAMLDNYSDDTSRIDHERRVLSALHHPFIVGMDYAFQTESLAIMLLGLVTGGDLQEALHQSKHNRLDERRVVFYTAEIILALQHLHDLGLMYRDLKPCNVLLCDDGHIKLADMGGVAEYADGTVLDNPNGNSKKIIEAAEIGETRGSKAEGDAAEKSTELKNVHRRRSIMGTHGYMAPEMVILLSQPRAVRVGYTKAVDYWSLGITVYKLLTGTRPFDRRSFDEFMNDSKCKMGEGFEKYQELLEKVEFPSFMSPQACDVVRGLLHGTEEQRLGCSPELLEKLKGHKFFESIEWEVLGQRHMIPPYIPNVQKPSETPFFPNFQSLMMDYALCEELDPGFEDGYDWNQTPTPEDDKHFGNWDFVSMHTLRIEMGIANVMESYDKNFKVQQMLGGQDDAAAAAKEAKPSGVFSLRAGKIMRPSLPHWGGGNNK
ncbi:unnamed protein product [Chrysoparadoxa australica]